MEAFSLTQSNKISEFTDIIAKKFLRLLQLKQIYDIDSLFFHLICFRLAEFGVQSPLMIQTVSLGRGSYVKSATGTACVRKENEKGYLVTHRF